MMMIYHCNSSLNDHENTYMHYHLRHQQYQTEVIGLTKVFVTGTEVYLTCQFTVKYRPFLLKKMNTNPSSGPYHFSAPSQSFWRTVRGENLIHYKLALEICY